MREKYIYDIWINIYCHNYVYEYFCSFYMQPVTLKI